MYSLESPIGGSVVNIRRCFEPGYESAIISPSEQAFKKGDRRAGGAFSVKELISRKVDSSAWQLTSPIDKSWGEFEAVGREIVWYL